MVRSYVEPIRGSGFAIQTSAVAALSELAFLNRYFLFVQFGSCSEIILERFDRFILVKLLNNQTVFRLVCLCQSTFFVTRLGTIPILRQHYLELFLAHPSTHNVSIVNTVLNVSKTGHYPTIQSFF